MVTQDLLRINLRQRHLCGRKRKPYLIFFGLIQTVTMFILFQVEFSSPMAVTMLLFTASFSMAFCAVVVDAILVV